VKGVFSSLFLFFSCLGAEGHILPANLILFHPHIFLFSNHVRHKKTHMQSTKVKEGRKVAT
jgi:hypothetical protein